MAGNAGGPSPQMIPYLYYEDAGAALEFMESMAAFGTRATPDPDAVSSMTYVYVDDVDAHCERARAAGAVIRAEPHVHFGGNRQYTASDPGGQRWTFAQAGTR
jgi:uncharacterized glyoxalase superfamily protein PhnB